MTTCPDIRHMIIRNGFFFCFVFSTKVQKYSYLALFYFCNFKNITKVLFLVNCMVYNKMSFWFVFYYTLCNTYSLSYFPYSVFAF